MSRPARLWPSLGLSVLILGAPAGLLAVEPSWTGPEQESMKQIEELMAARDYTRAEVAALSLLDDVESTHGNDSLEAALVIDELVYSMLHLGKENEESVLPLAERGVAIKKRSLPDGDLGLARSLANLGEISRRHNRFDRALDCFSRALDIRAAHLPPNHRDVARSHGAVANVLMQTGRYREARDHAERALEIVVEVFGPSSDPVAQNHLTVAQVLQNLGYFEQSKEHYETALDITMANHGEDDPITAWFLNGYGVFLHAIGDFAGARARLERAKTIRMKQNPAHPDVATVLNNLGRLFAETGDYASARSSHEEALRIRRQSMPADDPLIAQSLHNLAVVLTRLDRYEEAEPFFAEALSIRVDAFGARSPEVASSHQEHADLLRERGELDEARVRYEQARRIWKESLDPRHPDFALTLAGLAGILERTNRLAEAARLHGEALSIREGSLGHGHPLVAETLSRIGALEAAAGDFDRALERTLDAESILRSHILLTGRTLPERQALRYALTRTGGLDIALSIALHTGGRSHVERVWDGLVRSRAVILEEMAARNRAVTRAGDEETLSLWDQVRETRMRLARLVVQGADPHHPEQFLPLLEEALKQKEDAELRLVERSAAFREEHRAQRIGLSDVLGSIPPRAALAAYVKFDRGFRDASPEYAVFVSRRGQPPLMIPLGNAVEVEELVKAWRREASRGPLIHASIDQAEEAYRASGHRLRERIWDPVAGVLAGARSVLIVPDGALHHVSFASLPSGTERFLVEDGPTLHYLSAERDLVSGGRPGPRGVGLLALGAPDFDRSSHEGAIASAGAGPRTGRPSSPALRGTRSACGEFKSIRFEDLPAAAEEIGRIADVWERIMTGDSARRVHLTGAEASEEAFKTMAAGKRIIHLATHGFFLGDLCPSILPHGRAVAGLSPLTNHELPVIPGENPLLLAGLALAGANRRDTVPVDDEDGVLTAEEVASMNLDGLEWAVLSACDTGVGEVMTGEGVFGLRRAFEVAGARTVIMSLWSVKDEAALDWMDRLYSARFLEGLSTAEAARSASLRLLRDRREAGESPHPFYWAAFVAAGSWS